jgi:hypothetical protein
MSVISSIVKGHWTGFYEYDSCYKATISKAAFRMILDDLGNGRFSGKCIDLESTGSNTGIATIEGYVEDSFISFTKEYPTFFETDESGSEIEITSTSKPLLTYMGQYDWLNKLFQAHGKFSWMTKKTKEVI